MTDKSRPYDHLKRDVPTTIALLAAVAASAMPVLSLTFILVPHGYTASRGNPLYWLIMLPVVYWVWAAMAFDPWAIRMIALILVLAPIVDGLIALFSGMSGGDLTALWVLAALSLVLSIVGIVALSRTPLWPLRRR